MTNTDATLLVVLEIEQERIRQQEQEGWTQEHDDAHTDGELAQAAATYALIGSNKPLSCATPLWPWAPEWLKLTNRRRVLIKAAALIVAEIERLDRLPIPAPTEPQQ